MGDVDMKAAIDIEELTPEWLSEVLGYEVKGFTQTAVGTGQMGASYRLTLDSDSGPKTMLLKVARGERDARAAISVGYAAEVGFYRELASTVDVKVPDCYHAAISDDKLCFSLLLEDLAPRVPGVQAEGCSVERAKAALDNLAGLHAPRWNDPKLKDITFSMSAQGDEAAEFLGTLMGQATQEFNERYRETLGPDDIETLQAAAKHIGAWIRREPGHFTLLHGDYRLDNLMFGEQVDDVYALDWQTMAIGPAGRDLAYFIGTCLDIDVRRENEADLISHYHNGLLERGVSNYGLDDCREDYRLGQLQASLITTIGAIFANGERSESSDAMFLAMAKRSCAAIRDCKTYELF